MRIENPKSLNSTANIFGLIGSSLNHSFSSDYFNSKFEKLELSENQYLNFEIDEIEKIQQLIELNPNIQGLNITIPYKSAVLPYLSLIDETANKIGAVNTIKIIRQKKSIHLLGYNTDWQGFLQAYDNLIVRHEKAIILGSGGASKAIQFALKNRRIPFQIVSRNKSKQIIGYEDLHSSHLSSSLIINTTPLGTSPNLDQMPLLPLHLINQSNTLIDLIYNPEKTKLMNSIEERGAKVVNGYDMLVAQAELSWKIWNT